MACISKLASAIAYDCDTGTTGLISAVIINKADIVSYVVDSGGATVKGLTLAAGAKAYRVDTIKRSLVVSSALKINDGAPNAQSHAATGVVTSAQNGTWRLLMAALTNGSFVVVAKSSTVTWPLVYGLYYGLSSTVLDNNSHDNGGWTSFTMETPENVIGEDTLSMRMEDYDALYAAAVE